MDRLVTTLGRHSIMEEKERIKVCDPTMDTSKMFILNAHTL